MQRRPIACAFLLWYLAACTSWHVEQGVSPSQLISTTHPTAVRLTLSDNSHVVLNEPRIAVGDSVAGVSNDAPKSIAVSDVTQVATRKVNAGKTIGLGLAIVVGATLLVVAIDCGSSNPSSYCNKT